MAGAVDRRIPDHVVGERHPAEEADLEAEHRERVGLDRVAQRRQPAQLAACRCDREVLKQDPERPGERQVEDVLRAEGGRSDRPAGCPDDPFAADVTKCAAGTAVRIGEGHLPPRIAGALVHPGAMHVHPLARHPPSAREVRPESDRSQVERGQRKGDVHDRHVLAVTQHDDVGGDHERGRESKSERHPGEKLKPGRSHAQS